jgi:hypothetical protein
MDAMARYISNTQLVLDGIPLENATWEEINEFAHTFDGYTASGSFDRCADIARQRRHGTLTELRTCLFFEARALRHGGEEPDEQQLCYLGSLVRQIRGKVSAAEFA